MNSHFVKNNWHRAVFFALCLLTFYILPTTKESNCEKYQLYFWANYNQLENRSDVAQKCYEQLFNRHGSPYLYPGFLAHLMQTQQFEAIVQLIPVVEAIQKKDLPTQLIFISALEAVGKHGEAIQRLVTLSKQYPDHPEIIYYTASAHAENNRFEDALQVIDTYLSHATSQTSKNFIFYYLKAQIFSRNGNYAPAISNVKKSLELFPEFDQGWLLLGLIHELGGNLEEALTHYQTCLKIIGPNQLLERQILQLQLKRQNLVHHTCAHQPFAEALKAYDQKQYQKALQILNQSPHLENHTPSRLLKIELLCKLNSVDKAISLLLQWANNDETNDTWYRALHLLHKAGVAPAIILNAFSQLEQKNSKNILPLLYKADFYLRTQEKQQAINYLHKSLRYAHQPLLRTKILFQLGLLHYHDKKWDTMHELLIEGKNLNQNFSPLLNLLAYYYATEGNNLKEAENLILTVLKQEINPHFLDTHALILYKQKKYDDAHTMLSTIVKQIPQDSTVLYHLAKTMRKKGMHQEARATLEQAVNYCSMITDKGKYQKCLQNWPNKK